MTDRDDEPLAILDNVLWVPSDVLDDQTKEFTYEFESVVFEPQLHLPAKCANCDLWGKKWRPGRRTCSDLGYALHDVCDEFTHRTFPKKEIHVVKTWKEVGEWTVFARGDLGKIERLFGHLGIEDQRSPSRLKFPLKCTATLYPWQQPVADKWLEHGYGLLQAPTGWGKCLGKGTLVLMYDGTTKKVEDVGVGDLLVGPDSKPRRVRSTCTGKEPMYRVVPTKGDPYVVNESHILSLKLTPSKRGEKHTVVNLTVREYLEKSSWFRHRAKGWRASADFSSKPNPHPDLDPYLLGVWLGDGTARLPAVTTDDPEIVSLLESYAAQRGLSVRVEHVDNKCPVYHVTTEKNRGVNPLLNALRELGVLENKHVPHHYLTGSREGRKQLLAGLIDSDGHLKDGGGYDFVSKLEVLSDAVCFLARSLGLAAYKQECVKTCTNTGVEGTYYRVGISGDCSIIPCRLPRKQASPRRQKKDPLVTGIRLEPIGEGDYYGFEIEGPDRLFLLGDFTVTHNTVVWVYIIAKLGMKTLLLAQETRHLNVAYEGIMQFSNIAMLEAKLGKKLIGRVNKKYKLMGEDPETGLPVWRETNSAGAYYPITVATFQSFTSKRGKKLCKKLKNYFGVVWCEEAHHESAKTFHQVTKSFNPWYRGGQSATPSRKDQTHVAIFDTLGPVTARGKKEQMTPIVQFHNTNVFVPDSCFRFQYPKVKVVNHLARHKLYNEILLEKVLAEIEEGRKVLVITERVNHGIALMERIKQHGYTAVFEKGGQKKKKDEKKQSWYSQQLMLGELDAIIGTKVLNENWDVPPLDSLHLPFPNFGKEVEEQRVGRVRRFLHERHRAFLEEHGIDWDKPQPRVHVYTWTCNDDSKGGNYASAATGFRIQLYKKWGFDLDDSVNHVETKHKKKTMKELLGNDEEDD